jgi:murein DD-endopeptidase MepM/ murein hydrolase activator NlpD
VLGPPLRGGDWLAANGPSNTSGHRRALVPIDGGTYIAQRFATDWARIGADGRLVDGDPVDNASYHGYGAEVIAVADAVVASVTDGIPENAAGSPPLRSAAARDTLRAVPLTLETVGGNYVILDLGQGRYAFYGHLIPGSLRVKPGDRVRRGQVIGLLGNSGNSTGPHLHFHLSDRNTALAAEGVPYVIDGRDLMRGPGEWERRTNELPIQNERVRFPGN